MDAEDRRDLLGTTLQLLVPLRIAELARAGGPQPLDMERAGAAAQAIAEHGDVLLYGGGKRGEPGRLAADLAHGIAVMAFFPGGITLFGQHWEAVAEVADGRN